MFAGAAGGAGRGRGSRRVARGSPRLATGIRATSGRPLYRGLPCPRVKTATIHGQAPRRRFAEPGTDAGRGAALVRTEGASFSPQAVCPRATRVNNLQW